MATTMTITEALQDLKTTQKKIEAKQDFVKRNATRACALADPLQSKGGQTNAVREAMQAILDLQEYKLKLRRAIQTANDQTIVEVGGVSRSINEWLVWRREIAPTTQKFVLELRSEVVKATREAMQRMQQAPNAELRDQLGVRVNIDEQNLQESVELLDEILSKLDGQLSLKNATVKIEV